MKDLTINAQLTGDDAYARAFTTWQRTLGKAGIGPFQAMLDVLPTEPALACEAGASILTHLLTVGHQEVHVSQLASTVDAVCTHASPGSLRQSPECYIRVVQALIVIAHHFTDVEALESSATPFYVCIFQENKMLATVEKLLNEEPDLARNEWYDYITNKLAGSCWKTIEDLYDVRSADTPDVANIMMTAYPMMLAEYLGKDKITAGILPATLA